MSQRLQVYETDQIRVTFDPKVCIHSGACLRALPAVFDVSRRKWIDPGQADTRTVMETVAKCPSGALRATLVTSVYRTLPEAPVPVHPASSPSSPDVTVAVRERGPLLVEGSFRVVRADGTVLSEGKTCALCRCGRSRNKPFCDNSHRTVDWDALDVG
jgi:uncharacterized Fe-S cluster protein YjdI